MEPLTVRLTDDRVVISTDDGRTAQPNAEAAEALRAATAEVIAPLELKAWTFGRPTAGTLAAVAEARLLRPREGGYIPSFPESQAGDEKRIRLGSLVQPTTRPFADILASRRSQRSFGPMTLADLADVIVPSARVQRWWKAPDGYTATERPVPSAGGRHPLDLALLALNVHGVEPGLWHFDPALCDLVRADLPTDVGRAALAEVLRAFEGDGTPAAAIFVIADFSRTLSRYPNGMSLVFRDAGALLATLHLSASASGVASCIVGTTGALVYEVDEILIADVGAVLVGSRN
jgi:SagB-type dehydrogenase family enzyme